MLALLGPSGAGKTSLLDMLTMDLRAGVGGTVTINGQPVTRQPHIKERQAFLL